MRARSLTSLMQVPEEKRFAVLAEGLRLLADSVNTLSVDAAGLVDRPSTQSAAVLRMFAQEEAAKIAIIFDLARAGWGDTAAVEGSMRHFYDHLSRGLYARVYDGRPADLTEVRGYVEVMRREFHLDGPMDVDYIFANDVLTDREERLYVDLIEYEDHTRRWVGPAEQAATGDDRFLFDLGPGVLVELVQAMDRLGLLTESGLAATRTVWADATLDGSTHWQEIRARNGLVLDLLAELDGWTYDDEQIRRNAALVMDRWCFPLSGFDLKIRKVKMAELERERQARLAYEMGYPSDF